VKSTNVFISHPTPFNRDQRDFILLLEDKLKQFDLNPINLGKNNWSYKSPLQPIKKIMSTCKAAVIIGLERHHSFIGYEKELTKDSKELIHKYTTTPWVQIEAGMAYQAGLPLIILKEKKVFAEGILDPNLSEYYVFEFDLKKSCKKLPKGLSPMIHSWVKSFKSL
jgi:hypothetical protein